MEMLIACKLQLLPPSGSKNEMQSTIEQSEKRKVNLDIFTLAWRKELVPKWEKQKRTILISVLFQCLLINQQPRTKLAS